MLGGRGCDVVAVGLLAESRTKPTLDSAPLLLLTPPSAAAKARSRSTRERGIPPPEKEKKRSANAGRPSVSRAAPAPCLGRGCSRHSRQYV